MKVISPHVTILIITLISLGKSQGTPDISRTDELVSILRKESRLASQARVSTRKGKTVAFEVDEKTLTSAASIDFDSMVTPKPPLYKTSPSRYERKAINNRNMDSPGRNSDRPTHDFHHVEYSSKSKTNKFADDKENVQESFRSAEKDKQYSGRSLDQVSFKIQSMNNSASKIMDLLTVDKKDHRIPESGHTSVQEDRIRGHSRQTSDSYSFTQTSFSKPDKTLNTVEIHSIEVPSKHTDGESTQSRISGNTRYREQPESLENYINERLKPVQPLGERYEDVSGVIGLIFQDNKSVASVDDSNLDNLKTKLQDLQKNKLALEQRMQDFERRLKESKKKM